jgi:hypothetical protein
MDLLTDDKTKIYNDYTMVSSYIVGYEDNTCIYASHTTSLLMSMSQSDCPLCFKHTIRNNLSWINPLSLDACNACVYHYNKSVRIPVCDYIRYVNERTTNEDSLIYINNIGDVRASWRDGKRRYHQHLYTPGKSHDYNHREYIRRKYIRRLIMFAKSVLIKDIVNEIAARLIRL